MSEEEDDDTHAAPRSSTFRAGNLVASRYQINRFIAQGGMGEVYEALDLELRETVALKTVRPEVAEDPETLRRFKKEINLARKVTHPNVCRIYELGRTEVPFEPEDEGSARRRQLFLTMEFLVGESLERLIQRRRIPCDDVRQIATQIASALDAIHAKGIVHRDLKSGNVIILQEAGDLRAVVTDFGLAKRPAIAETFQTEGVVGTPEYMAPEQVQGKELGPAADIYALGIILYEMLTGKVPFVGPTSMATAVMRLTVTPPSVRTLRPDVDKELEQIVARCLEINPEKRFPSAAALRDALDYWTTQRIKRTRRAIEKRRYYFASGVILSAVVSALLSSRWPLPQGTALASASVHIGRMAEAKALVRAALAKNPKDSTARALLDKLEPDESAQR